MAVRISDLEPMGVGSIVKDDIFEIENWAQRKSYRVSAQAIAEFCKTVNNGAYKGASTKSLDEFSYLDAGVYWWTGAAPVGGMSCSGVLEVISATPPTANVVEQPYVIERLISGKDIWMRSGYPSGSSQSWSSWAALANKNGCAIFTGRTTDTSVTFPAAFKSTPVITCTPCGTSNQQLHFVCLNTYNTTGFTVLKYVIAKDETKQTETTEYTEDPVTQQHTVNKVTVETTAAAWTTENSDFEYHWIAICENG